MEDFMPAYLLHTFRFSDFPVESVCCNFLIGPVRTGLADSYPIRTRSELGLRVVLLIVEESGHSPDPPVGAP
ncbi:hypothetical protein TNCV_1048151 [Trichonephila clavipes]|nr:hypothetical protein TNCV_1048151 [Trichonephila clavipes]